MDGRAACSQRVRAHAHLSILICFYCGEGCIDGRGASFAVSAVEVLKASGPQGWAMSESPILVTYGPATTSTRGLLLRVWAWGGLWYNSPRDDWSQTTLEWTHLRAAKVSYEGWKACRIICEVILMYERLCRGGNYWRKMQSWPANVSNFLIICLKLLGVCVCLAFL